MRILCLSSKPYDNDNFNAADAPADYQLHFQQTRLAAGCMRLVALRRRATTMSSPRQRIGLAYA